MGIANDDRPSLVAGDPLHAFGNARPANGGGHGLALVDDALALAAPPGEPSPRWHAATEQLLSWLDVRVAQAKDRPAEIRQRVKWPWGAGARPAAPAFAPWIAHACTAFQDPRGVKDLIPARWVASYLWDPHCSSRLVTRGVIDVMLISPHPARCRQDEESCVALPDARLLLEMIGAARAEGRRRIAIVGPARSRSVSARQLLAARPMLRDAPADLEVLAIEEALVRLAVEPGCWDAIIVLPELRSLVFALLAELTGIGGAWPMVWQRQGLVLVCGETLGAIAPDGALDAALLVQGLALVLRAGGKAPAARRLAGAWARLRDRGLVTPTRGSPAPYCTQTGDAEFLAELCRSPEATGRPLPEWQTMLLPADPEDRSAAAREPVRLALVAER